MKVSKVNEHLLHSVGKPSFSFFSWISECYTWVICWDSSVLNNTFNNTHVPCGDKLQCLLWAGRKYLSPQLPPALSCYQRKRNVPEQLSEYLVYYSRVLPMGSAPFFPFFSIIEARDLGLPGEQTAQSKLHSPMSTALQHPGQIPLPRLAERTPSFSPHLSRT